MSGSLVIDPSNFQSKLKLTAACPQVTVKVDNEDVQCLLDTGSQVALLSESLCNELFKDKERGGVLSWCGKWRVMKGVTDNATWGVSPQEIVI